MAYSEAEMKLGVTDHPSRAETGGGAGREKKNPTKLSDFDLGIGCGYQQWVSVSDNYD